MCMTDAGTTQDYFILPAPPVGGLPISQDWLDRMKLVRDRTMPSGKDILVDTMFKIIIGYTNLGTRQIQCIGRKASRCWEFAAKYRLTVIAFCLWGFSLSLLLLFFFVFF